MPMATSMDTKGHTMRAPLPPLLRRLTRFVVTMATLSTLHAGPPAHAGPHVHGELQLGVAIDGDTLTLDLEAPLESLLGFERAPRTPAEKALVQRWDRLLRAPGPLLRFDEAAGCRLQSADFDSPLPGLGELDDASTDGHAEVEGQWVFRCQHPAALKALKVGLFQQSRHLRRIEVQRLDSQGQSRLVLTRPHDTIVLNGPTSR